VTTRIGGPAPDVIDVDRGVRGQRRVDLGGRWYVRTVRRPESVVAAATIAVVCTASTLNTVVPTGLNDGTVTTGALITASLFAYVVTGTLAAWLGVAERRSGLDQLSRTSVGRWYRDRFVRVLAAGSVTAAGFVMCAVVTLAWSLGHSYRSGLIDLGAVCACVLMIAVHAPVGYLVGRWLPTRVTPLAVAVLTLLLDSSLGSSYGSTISLLVPASSVDPSAFVTWNGHVFLAQCVWFAGVFGSLTVVCVGRADQKRRAVLVAILSVSVALVGLLLLAPYHGKRFAPGVVVGVDARQARCAGDDPKLCVPPAYRGVRAQLAEQFHGFMGRVEGTPAWASRLELRPRGVGQKPSQGARAIHTDVATSAAPGLAVEEYVDDLLSDTCWDTDAGKALPWEQIVHDWLIAGSPEGAPPAPDSAASARAWFTGLDADEQRSWFREHYADFAACRLDAGDFR